MSDPETPAAVTSGGDLHSAAPQQQPAEPGPESAQQVPALEPDTLLNRPLRASDVPGFIPKLIG